MSTYQVIELNDYSMYKIDLDTLEITNTDETELESLIDGGVDYFVNAEKLHTGKININEFFNLSASGIEIDTDGLYLSDDLYERNLRIHDTLLKINYGESFVKFGETKYKIDNHLVEELYILYVFKYDDFFIFRLELVLDYDDPCFCTMIIDKTIDSIVYLKSDDENIFETVRGSDNFVFKQIILPDLRKYMSFSYSPSLY